MPRRCDILAQNSLIFRVLYLVAFNTSFEPYRHTFLRSRIQLVFLDVIVGRTSKYPKWIVVLSSVPWPNLRGSYLLSQMMVTYWWD